VSETIATGVRTQRVHARSGRRFPPRPRTDRRRRRYHAHFVPDDDATADFYQQACEMLEAAVWHSTKFPTSPASRRILKIKGCPVQALLGRTVTHESRHNLKYWTPALSRFGVVPLHAGGQWHNTDVGRASARHTRLARRLHESRAAHCDASLRAGGHRNRSSSASA